VKHIIETAELVYIRQLNVRDCR